MCENASPPHLEYSLERKEKYRQIMLGNTINSGRIQSEEEKLKRGNSLRKLYENGGRIVTDEMKNTLDQTGKIRNKETRDKISTNAKNRSEEHRNNLKKSQRKAAAKRKADGLLPWNARSITINGVTYLTIVNAATALGISVYKVKLLDDNK